MADGASSPGSPGATALIDSIPPGGHVLVVDDLPANLRLLTGILKVAGYTVSSATSGAQALQHIQQLPPDVVLLDIMMPDMDGFEVCRRIKANPATAYLPVVMVTALQEITDRVTALEVGADDFLTKPVEESEVVARVKSLVRLKRQHEALERSYRDLQRTETLRDSLVAMLVHDLRTPLTGILAPLEMLSGNDFGHLDEEQRELISICTQNGYGLLDLINQLLDINKLESGAMRLELKRVDLNLLVDEAIRQVTPLVLAGSHHLSASIEPEAALVDVDRDLVKRVLVNLLGNAIKFTPNGSTIRVTARRGPESNSRPTDTAGVIVAVTDNGPGILPEDQERIFEKFAQAEARQAGRKLSTGLGLTFCRLAVEAHGGRIWVEGAPGQGSTFRFSLKPLDTSQSVAIEREMIR